MKSIISLAIVLILFANVAGAQEPKISAAVSTSFNREFKDASNVRWTKMGDIFMSRFELQQEHYIAYFKNNGTPILTGRKIGFDIVPVIVKKETERRLKMYADEGTRLDVRETYELAHNGTEYYMNLSGQTMTVSILVYGNGKSTVLKKEKRALNESIDPVLAADAH